MLRSIALALVAALAMLALSASLAQAQVKSCAHNGAPVLCAIHHWVKVRHHYQDALGTARTPYHYRAERSRSTEFRLWVRHHWYKRAMHVKHTYHHMLSTSPTGIIWSIWAPVVGPAETQKAVHVASCESGLRPDAYNPSGATGLFQILGGPFDPVANTKLALRMYLARGWEPWVASQFCWG